MSRNTMVETHDINKVKSKKLIKKSDKLIDFLYIYSNCMPNA